MRPFDTLSFRGQLARLRRLAEEALALYGVESAELVLLAHDENTTFRAVASDGERYVLRIHRVSGSPFHLPRSIEEVRSEMSWLSALRRDTDLAVPEPVVSSDGSIVTVAEVEGTPPRICALFGWQPGRFLDAGLTTRHLERVGELTARLHDHAQRFTPPSSFTRWQRCDLSDDVAAYVAGAVGATFGAAASSIVDATIDTVRHAQDELGTTPDVFGLIHGDLHQENYLFDRGRVGAIDFDDCGWGHLVFDLTVVLSELRGRPDYDALRAGLLRGYRTVRPLPIELERYMEVFYALRLLQLTLWILEQREHPAFSGWETEVRDGLAELRTLARDTT